jgi:hypothetical protein
MLGRASCSTAASSRSSTLLALARGGGGAMRRGIPVRHTSSDADADANADAGDRTADAPRPRLHDTKEFAKRQAVSCVCVCGVCAPTTHLNFFLPRFPLVVDAVVLGGQYRVLCRASTTTA